MSIQHNIKSLRKAKGMTLEELASTIGTSRQTIYKYENGIVTNIPYDRIISLANALNVTPAVLMGWESEEAKKKKASLSETSIDDDLIREALNNLSEDQLRDVLQYVKFLKSQRGDK